MSHVTHMYESSSFARMLICAIWPIHIWDMTYPHVRHDLCIVRGNQKFCLVIRQLRESILKLAFRCSVCSARVRFLSVCTAFCDLVVTWLIQFATWLIHMRDIAHSSMCDMTHFNAWRDSCIYVWRWLIHLRDMTHVSMCDMTQLYAWHDSCIYAWHNSFISVT